MERTILVLAVGLLSVAATFGQAWKLERTTDPIDDTETVVLSTGSDDVNSADKMALEIHHKVGETNKYDKDILLVGINENTLSDDAKITLRFDKEKAYTEKWITNGQKNCLVWPNAAYVISMILKSKQLAVRIETSYKQMTAVFNVSGLREVLINSKFASLDWFKPNYAYDEDMKASMIKLFKQQDVSLDMIPFTDFSWRYVILNYGDYTGKDDQLKATIKATLDSAGQENKKMPAMQSFYTSYDLTDEYYIYNNYQ